MILNKKTFLILAVCSSLTGCSDSFLESTPVMSETESSFYKNDDQYSEH